MSPISVLTSPQASVAALTQPCRGLVTELLLDSGRGNTEAFGRVVDLFEVIVFARVLDEDRAVEFFIALWSACPTFRVGGRGAVAWILQRLTTYEAGR
ncbi:MAG: hypothetical protein ABIR39_06865 [Nocardioides sp.]|uniref:hypothetical protein n=1 Tax=Nocardioides sp. TaxID=35761 RepID=UPI0032673C4D